MAFIAGAIIGTVGALAGAKLQSNAAKKATDAQTAASNKDIAYQKETRDLLRQDQEPYRKAGYKALDALMSLTGLGGGAPSGPAIRNPMSDRPFIGNAGFTDQPWRKKNVRGSAYGGSGYSPKFRNRDVFESRAQGGPIEDGQYYNINELGPESVYMDGEYTRTPSPRTISGDGYVQPNIKGRAIGGFMQNRDIKYGGLDRWGGPQRIPGGSGTPGTTYGNTYGRGSDTQGNFVGYPSGAQNADTTAVNPQTGYPNENPGGVEGGYQFQTDPGYQFRFEEGQRALDRGAAARSGLLSGGYARKAIRYGQGFASNEYTNVYNRIANIAGLGQTANQANMYAGLQAAAGVGNALGNQGYGQASGYTAQGNAWANAANDIASLPWGDIFTKDRGNSSPT